MKLSSKVICYEDFDEIKEDQNKLIDWSEKWLMSFNTEKLYILLTKI